MQVALSVYSFLLHFLLALLQYLASSRILAWLACIWGRIGHLWAAFTWAYCFVRILVSSELLTTLWEVSERRTGQRKRVLKVDLLV
jgi:hypothetical protein